MQINPDDEEVALSLLRLYVLTFLVRRHTNYSRELSKPTARTSIINMSLIGLLYLYLISRQSNLISILFFLNIAFTIIS